MLIEIRATSIFGKLLAGEHLNVIEDISAKTACIDLEKRIVYIPAWKNISDSLSRLFISHEVSHALWTPVDKWIESAKNRRQNSNIYKFIMNVIEDYRIEKNLLLKYPGLKKDYISGYKELLDMGFFNSEDNDNNNLFLNKLNVFLKINGTANLNHNISLTNDEKNDIDRVIKSVNLIDFDVVLELSDYIYDKYHNQNQNNMSVKQKGHVQYIIGDEEQENISDTDTDIVHDNSNDIFDASKIKNKKNNCVGDTWVIPKIQNVTTNINKKINTNNKNITEDVKYLFTSFNRRKNAKAYNQTKFIKTGSLDVDRLFEYKFKDDIFIKNKIMKKQLNHAIYLLIDASSSMTLLWKSVVDTVDLMINFCKLSKN